MDLEIKKRIWERICKIYWWPRSWNKA